MELYERIERTRFLGREFLVWIWWKSELFDGEMAVGGAGTCEVWLDDQLILEAKGADIVEQSRMKGGSPSATPEAKEALRQGKVPTKTRISISQQEREFSFVLEGEPFALSGVKTPTLLQEEREEKFYERMYLLEELEEMIHALYNEFLVLRLTPAWEREIAPAISAWVREEPEMNTAEYLEVVQKARAWLAEKQPGRPPQPSAEPSAPAEPDEPKDHAAASSSAAPTL